MRKIFAGCAAALLVLSMAFSAYALEVPTDTTVRNLDGVQECIKVFTVSPDTDAAALVEEPFAYNGYLYTYTGMVKRENPAGETKSHRETVTVETKKKDLDVILAELEPSVPYDDGTFHGVLNLDHTSIKTEASGYTSGSYAVSDVKEIGGLSSNDMSFVPATTVKNGVTLKLSNVSWKVQSTDLLDDVLVPASYTAVATYSGTAWYNTAVSYITTADYVGDITSSGIGSITYTLTYTGTEIVPETPEPTPTPEPEPEPVPVTHEPGLETDNQDNPLRQVDSQRSFVPVWVWIAGGALLLVLIAFGVVLIIVVRKQGAHEQRYYETEGHEYEDRN